MTNENPRIRASDIEVEQAAPGPIIHIFPPGNVDATLQDIVQGIHLKKLMEELLKDTDEYLREDIENWLKMAFFHMRKELQKTMNESQKVSTEFMKHIKHYKTEPDN